MRDLSLILCLRIQNTQTNVFSDPINVNVRQNLFMF